MANVVYVQRDADHKVQGVYSNLQPGYAEEALDDSDAEVTSFFANIRGATPTPPN